MRSIEVAYQDPLDLVWLHAATEMGIRVERDESVFAAWDGRGTLRIGTPETLDPDDTLAQMIFHEVCHALVEGPDALCQPDWGLDITDPSQRVREHACLRLQASLAGQHQLRNFLASTTNFRTYYDQLPADPLADDGDPATPLARTGFDRATTGPWSSALRSALERTNRIAAIVREIAPSSSLWFLSALPQAGGSRKGGTGSASV